MAPAMWILSSSVLLRESTRGVTLPGAPGGGGTGRGFHLELERVSPCGPWGLNVSSGFVIVAQPPPSFLSIEDDDEDEVDGNLRGAGGWMLPSDFVWRCCEWYPGASTRSRSLPPSLRPPSCECPKSLNTGRSCNSGLTGLLGFPVAVAGLVITVSDSGGSW